MSTSSARDDLTTATCHRRPAMLVCVGTAAGQQPRVVVATGSYDAGDERVFWREDPDHVVLRLPAAAPVVTRQLRVAPDETRLAGEQALAAAIRRSRPSAVPTSRPASAPDAPISALQKRECPLTARELEVLLGIADGRSTEGLATRLGVTSATVKTHLDHVFAKTRTPTRAAAVALALRLGWIA